MNSAHAKASNHEIDVQLKVSRYDQAASLLISLLILVGVSVALLLVAWVTQTLTFHGSWTVITADKSPRQNERAGFDLALATLGMEEMPELAEPQLATELQAVTDAAATVVAATDAIDAASLKSSVGDRDQDAAPPRNDAISILEDDGFVPRWKRWQIRWASSNLDEHARRLDYFKIELGAVGGQPMVDYAAKVSRAKPRTRTGKSNDEKRLYMSWHDGKLMKFEKTLLGRAGIPTTDRLILHFYPEEVEDALAWIELEHGTKMGHKSIKEFRKTYFAVRPHGAGYEFFVEDQQFRPAPVER